MSLIYFEPIASAPQRNAIVKKTFHKYEKFFKTEDMAGEFLRHTFTPRSQRWAFCGNGKSGTSSTFRFLFQAEFGSELNVKYEDMVDINSDVIFHKTKEHGIFRSLLQQAASFESIPKDYRFSIVRHPINRAISSFTYFCKSNEMASAWMLRDRIWCNALVKFDWEKDPFTPQGFIKFLEYIERILIYENKPHLVNPHWRPQYLNICPEVYQPSVIGRLEEFDNFIKSISERLNFTFNSHGSRSRSNTQPEYDKSIYIKDPVATKKIIDIYQADFEIFEYTTTSPNM